MPVNTFKASPLLVLAFDTPSSELRLVFLACFVVLVFMLYVAALFMRGGKELSDFRDIVKLF